MENELIHLVFKSNFLDALDISFFITGLIDIADSSSDHPISVDGKFIIEIFVSTDEFRRLLYIHFLFYGSLFVIFSLLIITFNYALNILPYRKSRRTEERRK